MFIFRKFWRALLSGNTRFEIRPFALLPTISSPITILLRQCRFWDCVSSVKATFFDKIVFLWGMSENSKEEYLKKEWGIKCK